MAALDSFSMPFHYNDDLKGTHAANSFVFPAKQFPLDEYKAIGMWEQVPVFKQTREKDPKPNVEKMLESLQTEIANLVAYSASAVFSQTMELNTLLNKNVAWVLEDLTNSDLSTTPRLKHEKSHAYSQIARNFSQPVLNDIKSQSGASEVVGAQLAIALLTLAFF